VFSITSSEESGNCYKLIGIRNHSQPFLAAARRGRRPNTVGSWRSDTPSIAAASLMLNSGKPPEVNQSRLQGSCFSSLARASSSASSFSSRWRVANAAVSTSTRRHCPPHFSALLWRALSTRLAAWPPRQRQKSGRGCSSADLVHVHQPEIGLVHQGRGLERLPGLLVSQPSRRQLAAAPRTSAATVLAACGSPCSMADRMRVTSFHAAHESWLAAWQGLIHGMDID